MILSLFRLTIALLWLAAAAVLVALPAAGLCLGCLLYTSPSPRDH
jgi:hypothetical protein